MTSIQTNASAVAVLSVLRGINSSLGSEQSKVSSGLRIATAADNAAYWSIATTMRSEAKAMTAVSDGIGLARGIVDTAYTAMQTVHDSFVEIRNLAVIASQEPAPKFASVIIGGFFADREYAKSSIAKLDQQMQQYQNQARDAIESASFGGINLVHHTKNEPKKASETVRSFVVGYAEGKVQTMDVKAMDLLLINDASGEEPYPYVLGYNPEASLFDSLETVLAPGSLHPAAVTWFNADGTDPITGDFDTVDISPSWVLMGIENNIVRNGGDRQGLYSVFVDYIDKHLEALTDRMAYLGSVQQGLETHDEANRARIDVVTKGIGELVDADMGEASARVRALETQQQLAVQGLSIANAQSDIILPLFQ
ncbi:flagellin [Rhizobium sp. PP-CC-3G-465]|uniref:flagellin N-terminal helical domain-containing protein n=1 Tax=Rhizobium sp. PP-CC-3G-465 TaxID=2135648 RepID=UPI0010D05B82|nr:flagellin [Rhizobium sp. PP-CC-3G-465]